MIALSPFRTPISWDPTRLALAGILLLAFAIRIYGWNWDDGNYLHPDERHIVNDVMIGRIHFSWSDPLDNLFDTATSGLNPRSADPATGNYREFAYGAMPVILTKFTAEVLGWFTATDWHAYEHAYKIGRPLTALLDTLTVLVVFLIGTRLAGRRVGVLAAIIAALTPLTIQLAHFFTTDSWLTFFVTLCLYCCLRAADSGTVRWFVAAGATFGWAMACKGSVFTLLTVLAVAGLYHLWWRWRLGEDWTGLLTAAAERLALTGVAAMLAFAMFEPYALVNPAVYRESLATQAEIVRGLFDVPFTRQYIGTTPILYQAEQLFRWELGPVATVLALVGAVLLVWRQRRGIGAAALVLLTWLAIYGVVISVPEAKFIRYLAPVAPVLAVLAGLALDAAWRGLARRFTPRIGIAFAALMLAGIGFWGASFVSIYAQENTRLVASAWIYGNVPSGSILSNEYWDDQLPKDLGPGLNGDDRQYGSVTFDLYADRVSYRDLLVVADSLDRHPPMQPAGEALRTGDYGLAAELLRGVGRSVSSLIQTERDALAEGLDTVAAGLRGPVGALGGACRGAAQALREDLEAVPAAFDELGGELLAAAENEAANYLYRQLEAIDYYVISSNRVLSAMPRSPWRYPVQARFYETLASGELGFTLVADIHRHPGIGPIRFDDDGADESFLNYDHPHVWIYQKTGLIDLPAYNALMADARMQEVTPARYPDEELMLDQPVGSLDVVDDARWSAVLTDDSVAALLVWLVLLVVLQAAAWPWARLVFGRFADGGWNFARLLALLMAGYIVWLGASVELISFRAIWAAFALLGVAAAGWFVRWRWPALGGGWGLTGAQRRTALVGEAVFWGVFGLFLLFRYLNPDSWHPLWGGEKPMEFAHLNATLRSAHFPPFDPWFADGYINYYYYGLYLVAFCLKLTGIPSEIGFNLAQPTIMAMIAAGGFGVAATLGCDLARRAIAVPAGLLGALLLVGIGNLDGFFRWLDQPDRRDFGYSTWDPTRVIEGTINEFPYFTGLYADLHAHVIAMPITVLAIALGFALAGEPRRVALALRRPSRNRAAVALVGARLALLGLAVGTLFATNAWDVATYLALGAAALFMATALIRPTLVRLVSWGLAVGILGALAYGLFLPFHADYVALFGSVAQVRATTDVWQFARHLGGLLAIVAIGTVAWLVARRGRDGGMLAQPGLPIALIVGALLVRSILPPDRTDLRDAMTVLTLAVLIVTLLAAGWIGTARDAIRAHDRVTTAIRIGLGIVGLVSLLMIATDRAVFGLMLALAAVAGVICFTDRNPAARYVGLMVGGAAAIAAGTEIIFLVDNLEGIDAYRMNTIFKFYNQVWVLLALGGGALAAWMLAAWWPSPGTVSDQLRRPAALGITDEAAIAPEEPEETSADPRPAAPRSLPAPLWPQAGIAVLAVMVALSLFYPVLATMPRLEQRFTTDLGSETLNALDWMEYGTLETRPDGGTLSFADDRAAINWLNANVPGSPVIAEASIGQYRCNGSRISIATGLPTIIGWLNHQTQQRYSEGLQRREDDVRTLYTATDVATKRAILERYDVAYVIVGSLERLNISVAGNDCVARPIPAAIAAFDQMVGTSLEVVFQQGGTTIYRVLPGTEGVAT